MNNALTKTMKSLVNNNKTAYDIVFNGINHRHRKQIAEFVASEVNTLKQFIKTDFNYCGELSFSKRLAIEVLQEKLIKYMDKIKVADTNKNVRAARKAVAKVIKKQVAKRTAKKNDNKVKGFKRGYEVKIVNKKYNFGEGKHTYEVFEVAGPKVEGKKYFVDEESVKLFIDKCEMNKISAAAVSGKSHGGMLARGIMKETADLKAALELPDIATELPNDRAMAKSNEDNDK